MLSATGLEKIAINEALIICLEFFVNQIFFFLGKKEVYLYNGGLFGHLWKVSKYRN